MTVVDHVASTFGGPGAVSAEGPDRRAADASPEARPDPLDIAVVAVQFPADPETFVSARLRSLVEAGHRVRVFAFRPPQEGWRSLLAERGLTGTPVEHNGPGPTWRGVVAALARPALFARAAGWLVRSCLTRPAHLVSGLAALPFAFHALAVLRQEAPDVVHLEWGHYPAVLVPLLRWSGIPCVISLSLIAYDLQTRFPGTRTAARLADFVRTQAQVNVPEVAELTGLDPERIMLIPDGVDLRRIDELRAGVSKVQGRVVVASRLVAEKGVDDALKAFAAAKDACPGATLHVMGSGPGLDGLKALANRLGIDQDVRFLGHVSHEEVIREFAAAEALLHLSHMERLPNAVKEGMACGCVVVTTRTVGIEELVIDGETGYLVDVRDHAAAGEALARVLSRPEEHEPMRVTAEELVRQTMDHSDSVRKLVGLWRRALAARRGAPGLVPGLAAHGDITS